MFPSPCDPCSFCQKCRLGPPESWEVQELEVPGRARFHFWENWPLNRMNALGKPAFGTSREVPKVTISTLPATTLAEAGEIRKTAVFRLFRPFRAERENQAALAYTFDRTGRNPGFQPGLHPGWPGSGSPEPGSRGPSSPDPGSQEPWMAGIQGPGGPWMAGSGPSRPLSPGRSWPAWTWMLSNTYPRSPWGDLGDRARPTEDTRT